MSLQAGDTYLEIRQCHHPRPCASGDAPVTLQIDQSDNLEVEKEGAGETSFNSPARENSKRRRREGS